MKLYIHTGNLRQQIQVLMTGMYGKLFSEADAGEFQDKFKYKKCDLSILASFFFPCDSYLYVVLGNFQPISG